MPICPKKKISRGRRNQKRAQSWRIPAVTLVECPSCSELILPHRACKACGYYKRVEVMKVKSD